MSITYRKLKQLMTEKEISEYRLKKEQIVGGATLDKLFGRAAGNIDTNTINNLCRYLNCQPGDIMEYVPDKEDI